MLIVPSPVTQARELADAFLNLRLGLALAISLTVYFWRNQNRVAVFGARGFGYVEAFALGFVANAAVSNFPAALAKLVP